MWLLLLFFLGAAPALAEDLGELSANPVGLSGSFSFFGLFGSFGFFGLSGFSGLSGSSGWLSDQPTK